MTDLVPAVSTADASVLQRRRFLRGGALLAAAAGGAVAASASSALPAAAVDPEVMAITVGIPPTRFLDTRTVEGRDFIVASSPSALDTKHRLKKNAWIDVIVFPADQELELTSVFVNLTGRSSTKAGSLVVTEPASGKPTGWTLGYSKGKTVSNGAIVGVGVSEDEAYYTVRIYSSATTHVTLNLTGVSALVSFDADERVLGRTSGRSVVARIIEAAASVKR